MTNNDDFTRDAKAAASRTSLVFMGNNDATYGYNSGFTTGAEWGRDQALAQKPTDAEIEAGKAVLESAGLRVFDGHLPGLSEHLTRKVLIAARDARRDEKK